MCSTALFTVVIKTPTENAWIFFYTDEGVRSKVGRGGFGESTVVEAGGTGQS